MSTKTTPKDFFIHLGTIIALYASVIALINLAFETVNRAFPDALSDYWGASAIVWPISMLVVLIPVLYVLEWVIGRDISKMPEKREVWVRRWRIYLTLFLTGATIAGDFIALINTYLNGEITSRFIYKILIVLIISAVVFAYYLFERMSDNSNNKIRQTILAWLGIILALGGIVAGFMIVGSPSTQRAIRFDQQRIDDLSSIQGQIINIWQKTGSLPDSIQGLNDPISNFTVPMDPDTRAPYEYNVKGKTIFELCADFSLSSKNNQARNGVLQSYPTMPISIDVGNANWDHSSGRVCFSRTIDPLKYPISPRTSGK